MILFFDIFRKFQIFNVSVAVEVSTTKIGTVVCSRRRCKEVVSLRLVQDLPTHREPLGR